MKSGEYKINREGDIINQIDRDKVEGSYRSKDGYRGIGCIQKF